MARSRSLVLKAILAAACLAAACSKSGVEPNIAGPPHTTIPLAIRVHPVAQLIQSDADTIAAKSSQILQTEDFSGDQACPVLLSVESFGPFTVPASVPPTSNVALGVIETSFDFNALFTGPSGPPPAETDEDGKPPKLRQVRVVSEIHWCGASMASAAGCSDGMRIAVVRRGADREGELWAHETGHTRLLNDRSTSWTAVMHPDILPDHKDLNKTECNLYRR